MKPLKLKDYIRSIPGFPKPGILFRDITPLLAEPRAFKAAINRLSAKYKNKKIDYVVAAEARGFIFGAAIACRLNAGFVPVRKKGKLPAKVHAAQYCLEYGIDSLEMHQDAFKPQARVLIVDDLLATGGTVAAILDLVKQLKGKVIGICFLIELTDLRGRDKLPGLPIYSLIKY